MMEQDWTWLLSPGHASWNELRIFLGPSGERVMEDQNFSASQELGGSPVSIEAALWYLAPL